jgi:predicted RNA-binding Zn ribbon-like protein
MENVYAGPVRSEPLAIELHNTIYAADGELADGLGDSAQAEAWLDALTLRLPVDDVPAGPAPTRAELIALREAVRTALREAMGGRPLDAAALDAINGASRRAPQSPEARREPDGQARPGTCFHGASHADIVLGAFARDAIDLTTGPHRHQLRACGAPGCVLLFLKQHPRREWCSQACGNRARQARHYQRTHDRQA